ncbi:MAG: hypothetical protein KatS3mg126_1225 [Lysobacteraceae bacterium]|nr:MAG: hypothetical protein KatS3mg126_1225 [Xanthomonadaceae bacterium]
MKTWMRAFSAFSSAAAARSMSWRWQRARAAMRGPRASRAMAATAAKSSGLAAAKPASITSTPSSHRARAMLSFCAVVIEQPGDCSPSRRVVSKMRT